MKPTLLCFSFLTVAITVAILAYAVFLAPDIAVMR